MQPPCGLSVRWLLQVGIGFAILFLMGLFIQFPWHLEWCEDTGMMPDLGPGSGVTHKPVKCLKIGRRSLRPSHRSSSSRSRSYEHSSDGAAWDPPWITIYAAPTPPVNDVQRCRLRRAISSWLKLGPTVRVVLLGSHGAVRSMAQEFSGDVGGSVRVVSDSEVDTTFDGVPLLNSVLERARAAESEIAVFIDPAESILLPGLSTALERARKLKDDWLLVSASSWKKAIRLPNCSDFKPSALIDKQSRKEKRQWSWINALLPTAFQSNDDERQAAGSQMKAAGPARCDGVALFAWNTARAPLHGGVTPSFITGYGGYQGWLLSEAIDSQLRHVIDGSDVITMVVERDEEESTDFQRSSKDHGTLRHQALHGDERLPSPPSLLTNKSDPAASSLSWQEEVNSYLALSYGRYSVSRGVLGDVPLRMTRCASGPGRVEESGRVCLVKNHGGGSSGSSSGSSSSSSRHGLHCRNYCQKLIKRHARQVERNRSDMEVVRNGDEQETPVGPPGTHRMRTQEEWSGLPRPQRLATAVRTLSASFAGVPEETNATVAHVAPCKCDEVASMCPRPVLSQSTSSIARRVSLPHTMEALAAQAAAGQEKLLVLTVAAFNYAEFLLSWICRMQALQLDNYIVGALDEDLYRMGVLRGLPVFHVRVYELDDGVPSPSPSMLSVNDTAASWLRKGTTLDKLPNRPNQCYFGTECFTRVTKFKSKTVLKLLQMGYNVLFSDVDVYWFKNPIPTMWSHGPGHLVVQSDNYKETGPGNEIRRLNSGFYLARNDSSTVDAFNQIVVHAMLSKGSEQPSFYINLCGSLGEYRVGTNMCRPPAFDNLTVVFLDRKLFPNGASYKLWDEMDPRTKCGERGCFVLHNNWVSGRELKLERQVLKGLMDFDMSKRSCKWPWENEKSVHIY